MCLSLYESLPWACLCRQGFEIANKELLNDQLLPDVINYLHPRRVIGKLSRDASCRDTTGKLHCLEVSSLFGL